MFAAFLKGFQTHRPALEFSLLKILKCLNVTKAAQLIVITCTLALAFEEDVQLSRLLQSDGAHASNGSGRTVFVAVAKRVGDTELSEVSADEVELSDSDDSLPMAGKVFSSDQDFAAPRSKKASTPFESTTQLRSSLNRRQVFNRREGGLIL